MRLRALILALMMAMVMLAAPGRAEPPPVAMERSALHTLTADANGRTYNLYVKLPPGYADAANKDRRYPVIYLTDGDYTFQVASGVTRLAHNAKKMRHAILVGLPTALGEDGMVSRRRDLTPWVNEAMPGPNGGGKAYVDFIKDQVLPLIDSSYRTEPTQRTFVGQSYGGLLGLWVLFTEPQLFSSYLLTSPSIWYAPRALADLAEASAGDPRYRTIRLFMATGGFETVKKGGGDPRYNQQNDMVADQTAMAARLRRLHKNGMAVHDLVVPGTIHETTFPIGFTYGMQWLYGEGTLGH